MALTPGWSGSKTIALKRLVNHILPFKTIIMVSQGSIHCQEIFQSFYKRGYPPPYFAFLRCRKKRSHTRKLKNQNSNNVMKMRQCQIGPDIERNIDKLLYAHQQQGRRRNRMPICLHTFFCTGLTDRQKKLKQRPQQQQRQKQLRYYLFLFVNNYFPFCALDIFYLMRYGIHTDYGPQGITTVHDFSCCRYPFFRFGGILCI